MKTLSKVVWSEGMYVGPHHFQAQNRYFEDFVHFATTSLWYEPYGYTGYEMDNEALRNGTVALVHARGLLPDGLAFHMPEFDPLPEARNILRAFPPTAESVDVLLAVAPHTPAGPNCALSEEECNPGVRYIASEASLPDDNTGGDEKPVRLGRKNLRLVLSTESLEGQVVLPLARVRRDGAGQFTYDAGFVPPCLQISASEALLGMLRRLIDVMDEKCRTIARPRDLSGQSVSGFSASGIANAWFLNCVNSSLGPLRHHCISKRAHPEEVFVELSRLAGALCTFSLDSHPASLPLYNHMALAGCFEALDRHIREHLELVVPSNCVQIALKQVARYFYAGEITDERTLYHSRWIFGIRCRIGEADLIESTPRLVKVCSRELLPRLVERALPGLKLTHLPAPPPAISPRIEYQYFSIDKAGPCWEHMAETRQMVIYIPGELPDPEIELSVILES